MKSILAILTTLLLPPLSAAELTLAGIFTDHAVLQRDAAAPVWGWADPNEKITVAFGNQQKTATADAQGKWLIKLDPMPASAEGRELIVRSATGNRESRISDVVVGEVWLGSGQSNMAMRVSNSLNYKNEQTKADFPLIRSFNEGSKSSAKAQANASGKWAVCSPETVGTFSATLYFFGRELHRELNVPVGIINSSVGGTPIESWIAAEVQPAKWKKAAASKPKAAAPLPAGKKAAPREPKSEIGGLFNGKIAPLLPYALRGVLWYQGEANTHPGKPNFYHDQLSLLVTDWRKRWGEELPFAWVQLPNFNRPGEGWSLVREAMLKSLSLPKTGMAITVDIGEADNIHPKNKQEVGRRLALWALGAVYDRKVPAISGPLPDGHEIKGDKIIVAFKHTEGGLVGKNGDLTGFLLAGADKIWKPARATINGDQVIVSSTEVAKPVAVRYGWESVAICNLYNGAGLPASPFRTDAWPVDVLEKE